MVWTRVEADALAEANTRTYLGVSEAWAEWRAWGNVGELVENNADLNDCSAFIGLQNGKAGFLGVE